MAGSAIKLWPLQEEQETLAVGEGIENVLAAVKLGIADPPAWATTVANNLSRVPVIRRRQATVHPCGQRSRRRGQEHAKALRRKWLDAAGRCWPRCRGRSARTSTTS